jgi:hypothetical protein
MKATPVRAVLILTASCAMITHAGARSGLASPAQIHRVAAAKQASAAATPTERRVPFRAGETLVYDVSWSTYLTAGVATLVVKDKRGSGASTAYYIVAEGRPTGLVSKLHSFYYKADTLLDSFALLPQRGSIYSEEGGRRRMRITRFDQTAHRAEFEMQTTTDVRRSLAVPPYSQDALSAVYVLRAIALQENARFTMPVCDGGSNYRIQVAIGRIEPVKTPAGSVNAFRVTPTILDERGQRVGRPLTLWVSADERRLPVMLRADLAIGSINLVLRQVTP